MRFSTPSPPGSPLRRRERALLRGVLVLLALVSSGGALLGLAGCADTGTGTAEKRPRVGPLGTQGPPRNIFERTAR
jgi:hypothetical protein